MYLSWFCFVLLTFLLNTVTGLEDGVGVCTKKKIITKSVYRTFEQPYYVEECTMYIFSCHNVIEYRTSGRFENVQQMVTKRECCDYYEEIGDECKPVCTPPCQNGYCTNPKVGCTCEDGYIPSEYVNQCKPFCTNCDNGDCTRPWNCVCHDGYRRQNDDCEPICSKPCVNSTCASPENCSCNDGYRETEDPAICAPHCATGCTNGVCVAPEVCACNNSFILVNGTCQPHCESECPNGKCIAPNLCECNEGYSLENDEHCIPNCHSCVFGECVAPNVCKCHEGYKLIDNKCYPQCGNGCDNGTCVAPNRCECNEGYISNGRDCVPTCPEECSDTLCSVEDSCQCYVGYEKINGLCVPVCDNGCSNGTCVAPNNCSCDIGYHETDGGCQPECPGGCFHGECVAPGECQCFEGYTDDTRGGCEPKCTKPCGFGRCTSPDFCLCYTGYKFLNGTCSPVCNGGCEANEVCSSPDICDCIAGYTKQDGGCLPLCEKGCEGGTCVAPNRCECPAGYRLHVREFQDETCLIPECKDSNDVEFIGTCDCNVGFKLNENNTCIEESYEETTVAYLELQSSDTEYTESNDDVSLRYATAEVAFHDTVKASGEIQSRSGWWCYGFAAATLTLVLLVILVIWLKRSLISSFIKRSYVIPQSRDHVDATVSLSQVQHREYNYAQTTEYNA